ncbi:PiggyBac transposable element-derived protein like [Argiope bruennichi]|uniref:PiggyBac transposable element-derived protein like n=1 Tax=Argiope bruennichi TaxID=94029 RepID=A0A8T0F1B6_ARGBR|nr:PiggyBac transposable element-derived protein like [Argiope bruennichi]
MSVSCIVEELRKEPYNPILIFKLQKSKTIWGPAHLDNLQNYESSFALGLQTKAQKDMLVKHSDKILCIDATHGTNFYDFYLLSLHVQDEYGQGYPVAHFITNDLDYHTLIALFSSLHCRIPDLNVNTVMTDDDGYSFKAFNSVFGPNIKHLLCQWHVFRAWKRQLSSKLKTIYLERKYNRRIDDLVSTLLEMERDRFLKYSCNVINNIPTHSKFTKTVKEKHDRAVKIQNTDVIEYDNHWEVKSQSVKGKIYVLYADVLSDCPSDFEFSDSDSDDSDIRPSKRQRRILSDSEADSDEEWNDIDIVPSLEDYSRNSRVPNFECDPPSIVDWKEVTTNDMKKFLGLLVLMGQTKKTCWRDYWSTDPLVEIPIFPKTMSRMRFEQIFTFFHLSDNVENVLSTDRLYKIRPLLDYVISKSQSMYVPKQQLSLDEAMIPWRGRLKFKTYNPAKITKYGILVRMVCESESGYICNFEVYSGVGKKLEETILSILQPYFGFNHHVYQDNYYNNVSTASILLQNKIRVCGTIRENRGLPKLLIEKSKNLQRRQMTFLRKGPILLLTRKDKRLVRMISTIHDASMITTGNRNKNYITIT